jgi:hypothetical protein
MKIKNKFNLSILVIFITLYSIGIFGLYLYVKTYFIENAASHYQTTIQLKANDINNFLNRIEDKIYEYGSTRYALQIQEILPTLNDNT